MEIRSLYRYYAFGFNYNHLKRGYSDNSIKTVVWGIKYFLENVDELDLKVTKRAVGRDLDDILKKLNKMVQTDTISVEDSEELKKLVTSIDKTVDSEMTFRKAYVLTQKRLGLENLMSDVSNLFGSGVFTQLPKLCQDDFMEAGKCLGFERYTAAAFHILRATEEMLLVYYKHRIKKKRVKLLMWYNMTNHLKGKRKVPDSLIAVLDSIREDFRNPTVHPEKKYSEDEVQNLFTHCVDVINRITKELKK